MWSAHSTSVQVAGSGIVRTSPPYAN